MIPIILARNLRFKYVYLPAQYHPDSDEVRNHNTNKYWLYGCRTAICDYHAMLFVGKQHAGQYLTF